VNQRIIQLDEEHIVHRSKLHQRSNTLSRHLTYCMILPLHQHLYKRISLTQCISHLYPLTLSHVDIPIMSSISININSPHYGLRQLMYSLTAHLSVSTFSFGSHQFLRLKNCLLNTNCIDAMQVFNTHSRTPYSLSFG
jgi:hypothetical protein